MTPLQKSKNESIEEFAQVKQDMDSQNERDSFAKQQKIETLEETLQKREEELSQINESHLEEINRLQKEIEVLKEDLEERNAKFKALKSTHLQCQDKISSLEKHT